MNIKLELTVEQICPEFWKWLPKEHAETDLITKLNMEVAFRAGKELGQLPTSSGAWPLVVKIKQQAEEQLPKEE